MPADCTAAAAAAAASFWGAPWATYPETLLPPPPPPPSPPTATATGTAASDTTAAVARRYFTLERYPCLTERRAGGGAGFRGALSGKANACSLRREAHLGRGRRCFWFRSVSSFVTRSAREIGREHRCARACLGAGR